MKFQKTLLFACILFWVYPSYASWQQERQEPPVPTGGQSGSQKDMERMHNLAEQGAPFAQLRLGMMYRDGDGVPRDYSEAMKWYRMAAEQGNVDGQINVGLMYLQGMGIAQDNLEAYFWLSLSAAALKGRAQEEIANLLSTVAEKMTAQQIAEVQQRVGQWQPEDNNQSGLTWIPPPSSETAPLQTAKTSPIPLVRSAPTQIQLVVPTLEQIKNVPSFVLGQGYQAVESTIGTVGLAIKYPNVSTILTIDGKLVSITKENAPGILQSLNERLQVYQQAIKQRGHSIIDGWYTLEVNQAIQRKEDLDLVVLFADAELSRHEYVLARELQIKQQDFSIKLIREMDTGGEKKDFSFSGLVIGDSIVFRVPNVNINFYGTLNDNMIELKANPNDRQRLSEWLVRLMRKPSNKPLEPSPSDQLLIITPDKQFRQVTRGEILLN